MKNKIKHITNMRLLLGFTTIAVLCTAVPVRAALPYSTASTVDQLADDINYANTNGGTFTINLQPNTSFTEGEGGILFFDIGFNAAVIKTVNLTIIGNGSTFNIAPGLWINFFDVFPGSSLTLEQMTLHNNSTAGGVDGGAVQNDGTLTISNCTLSGNTCANINDEQITPLLGAGGAIYNSGTLIIDDSILSSNSITGDYPLGGAIYNVGTVTISNSTFINNYTQGYGYGGAIYNDGGTVTISHSSFTSNYADGGLGAGGGILNQEGTVTVENSSKISGNWTILLTGTDSEEDSPDDVSNGGTLYLDSSSEIGVLDGTAIIVQGSGPSPSPQISLTSSNTVVISWPYPSTGWSLEQNSDLTTTNWVTSTNTVANDGTNNFIIATPSSNQLFFRLEF